MRILYLITQADGGGAQNYVLALAKHFQGAVAAGSEEQKLFIDAENQGLKTFRLEYLKRNISPYHDLMAIWEIRKLIQTYSPNIVHLNSSKAGFLGSLAGIGLKAKIIFTAHGFIFLEPMNWLKKSFFMALEKLASAHRDFIITVSEQDRQSALLLKPVGQNKILTVHNGIARLNFLDKNQVRTELHVPENKFLFGTLANFYKTKGLDVLIEAANLLPEDIKNHCQFVIFGHGPESENCKLKIKKLQLEKTFLLPGNLNNASLFLCGFDAFVLPSRKEGFPFAILEAMQAGLPIVATDVGGIKEALADAGLLVPPKNPKALAQALKRLFQDRALQKTLSNGSLERSTLFTEEKMLEKTADIYKKLLS